MGNTCPILSGHNVTLRFLMCSIFTNILTVLPNFLVIITQFLRKASVATMATLMYDAQWIEQLAAMDPERFGDITGYRTHTITV